MNSIPNRSNFAQGHVPIYDDNSPKTATSASTSPSVGDGSACNIPIATGAAAEIANGEETLWNKYRYPEFAGPGGEAYLKSLVIQIIPSALAHTWEAATSYQAPGNTCYVSSHRIQRDMKIKARDERTLRKHWQAFRTLGLASFTPTIKEMTDARGTHMAAVVDKNFDALYDLAHEFHLWIESGSYAQLPPDREYATSILHNHELAEQLVRFECYKSILINNPPGPKASSDPAQRIQEKLLAKMRAIAAENEKTAQKDAKRNVYLTTYPDIYSQDRKRKDLLEEDRLPNSNGFASSAELKKGDGSPAGAIGIVEEHTDTLPNDQATKAFTLPCNQEPTPEKSEKQQELAAAPLACLPEKPEEIEKVGKIETIEMQERIKTYRMGLEQIAGEKGLRSSADEKATLELAAALVVPIRVWLDDHAPEAKVVNTIKKWIRQSPIRVPRTVYQVMLLALMQTYTTPIERVRKHHDDGSVNRMPLFYEKLKTLLPMAALLPLETMIQQAEKLLEPAELVASARGEEEKDSETSPIVIQGEQIESVALQDVAEGHEMNNEDQPIDLDNGEVLLALAADQQIELSLELCLLLEQDDPEAKSAVRDELFFCIVEREAHRRQELVVDAACTRIQKAIKAGNVSGSRGAGAPETQLIMTERLCSCGCALTYRADDGQSRCVACDPSWRLSLTVQKVIASIARALPSYERIFDEVADEYGIGDDQGQS